MFLNLRALSLNVDSEEAATGVIVDIPLADRRKDPARSLTTVISIRQETYTHVEISSSTSPDSPRTTTHGSKRQRMLSSDS